MGWDNVGFLRADFAESGSRRPISSTDSPVCGICSLIDIHSVAESGQVNNWGVLLNLRPGKYGFCSVFRKSSYERRHADFALIYMGTITNTAPSSEKHLALKGEGRVIEVEFTGKLTREDYETFSPEVERMLQEFRK